MTNKIDFLYAIINILLFSCNFLRTSKNLHNNCTNGHVLLPVNPFYSDRRDGIFVVIYIIIENQ